MKKQEDSSFKNLSSMPIKKMFLIDGIGAFISAFFLGLILTPFADYFGMPKSSLYLLAAIPCGFLVYDCICYFFLNKHLPLLLKIIAYANLAYCGLSLRLAFQHKETLSTVAWVYIGLEIIIILFLVRLELKISQSTNP